MLLFQINLQTRLLPALELLPGRDALPRLNVDETVGLSDVDDGVEALRTR